MELETIRGLKIEGDFVTFEDDEGELTLPITTYGKLQTFQHEGLTFFVQESGDWNIKPFGKVMTTEILALFEKYKDAKGWDEYSEYIDNVVKENDNGNKDYKFGVRKQVKQWHSNRHTVSKYIHIGVTIGTRFDGRKGVFDGVYLVTKLFDNGSCSLKDKKTCMTTVYGTACCVIGIG